jgi:hypothetical protein
MSLRSDLDAPVKLTAAEQRILRIFRDLPEAEAEIEKHRDELFEVKRTIEARLAQAEEELDWRRSHGDRLHRKSLLESLGSESARLPARSVNTIRSVPGYQPEIPSEKTTLWWVLRVLHANPKGLALGELARILVDHGAYQSKQMRPVRSTASNIEALKKRGWRFRKPSHGVWALDGWPADVPLPAPLSRPK